MTERNNDECIFLRAHFTASFKVSCCILTCRSLSHTTPLSSFKKLRAKRLIHHRVRSLTESTYLLRGSCSTRLYLFRLMDQTRSRNMIYAGLIVSRRFPAFGQPIILFITSKTFHGDGSIYVEFRYRASKKAKAGNKVSRRVHKSRRFH